MTKCALCLHESQLAKSHIIPKFAYEPVQDEKKRSLPLSPNSDKLTFVQSGIKIELLCHQCEEILSNYEKELSTFLKEVQNGSDRIISFTDGIALASKFNFDKIHKALLSIIWRLSVIPSSNNKNSFFERYYLGKKNQEIIRNVILKDSTLPFYSFPITADKITINGEKRSDLILCFPYGKSLLGNVYIQSICLYGVIFNIYMKEDITPFFGKDKEILYLGGSFNPIQEQELSSVKIDINLFEKIRSAEVAKKMAILKINQ